MYRSLLCRIIIIFLSHENKKKVSNYNIITISKFQRVKADGRGIPGKEEEYHNNWWGKKSQSKGKSR